MFKTPSMLKDCQLLIEYNLLNNQGGYNELLCLQKIKNVEKYWYQTEHGFKENQQNLLK